MHSEGSYICHLR